VKHTIKQGEANDDQAGSSLPNIYTYKFQMSQSELRAAYCRTFNAILEPKLIIAINVNN